MADVLNKPIPRLVGLARWPVALAGASVLALAVTLSGSQRVAAEAPGTVVGSAFVADSDIVCAGSTQVSLQLTGQAATTATPTDVVLVLDESGSVSGTAFLQLQSFADNLTTMLGASGLFDNGGRMGLVMFADEARVVLTLSGDESEVRDEIHALVPPPAGFTCIGCGINAATEMLEEESTDGQARVMIVLTDGANNRPLVAPGPAGHLSAAVTAAEDAGILRLAVGVGGYVFSQLVLITGDRSRVFTAADFDSVGDVLDPLVAAITSPGGTGILVTWEMASAFSSAAASASHGDVSEVAGVFSWSIDSLGGETATLVYTATHSAGGGGTLPLHAELTYADNEENEVEFAELSVNVRGCAASVTLSPAAAVNESSGSPGQVHGVTALVADDFGDPVAGVDVDFAVTAGPNAGADMDSSATSLAGEADSEYATTASGLASLGTDTVEATVAVQPGVPAALWAAATAEWVDSTPPVAACPLGTNPAGRGAGGAAGFRTLSAWDDLWGEDVELYLKDPVSGVVFGPFAVGIKVKLTVAPDDTPSQTPMAGSVDWHIKTQGSAVLVAVDGSGNESEVTCGATP